MKCIQATKELLADIGLIDATSHVFRWLPVNSGAWLLRFDDVTGVEKSCVTKGINMKMQRKNILLLQINMRFPQTSNT